MKTCCRCQGLFPATEFYRRSCTSDGLSYHCKVCERRDRKASYQRTPDGAKACALRWARANPERRRIITKRWSAANPLVAIASNATRRARRSAAGRLDKRTAYLVLASANGRCAYCGATERLTLDHIDALARGGTNHWSNLVAVCARCNQRKGVKPVEDWLLEREGLEGLARALLALKVTKKVMQRLNPALMGQPITEV